MVPINSDNRCSTVKKYKPKPRRPSDVRYYFKKIHCDATCQLWYFRCRYQTLTTRTKTKLYNMSRR